MSNFHPPPRPEPKVVSKTWWEEFLERDELLLYLTATLGVVLPGIVYLIYQRVHNVYMKYAAKKEAERLAEEAAKCEVSVLRLGEGEKAAANFGTKLAGKLKEEMTQPVNEWTGTTVKTSQLTAFRGVLIFTVDGDCQEESSWLLDWMEDVAADAKARKKARFEDIRFAVVGFEGEDGKKAEKLLTTVSRRMKILGAKQLLPVALFQDPLKDQIFDNWFEAFMDELERHLPGAESSAEDQTSESELEEEEEVRERRNKKTI